jgi:CheY-like chemotaxis protein
MKRRRLGLVVPKGGGRMVAMDSTMDLSQRHVLVVEDEFYLADDLALELTSRGVTVVGPVADVEEALALLESGVEIDAAVLDINLRNVSVFPVAEALQEREVPFVFATGYDRSAIPTQFTSVPRLEKPYNLSDLLEILFGEGHGQAH